MRLKMQSARPTGGFSRPAGAAKPSSTQDYLQMQRAVDLRAERGRVYVMLCGSLIEKIARSCYGM